MPLRLLLTPGTPVRGMNFNPLMRPDIHPAIGDAAAGKHERVLAVLVEHGQLQIAIKWCGVDGLPHDWADSSKQASRALMCITLKGTLAVGLRSADCSDG